MGFRGIKTIGMRWAKEALCQLLVVSLVAYPVLVSQAEASSQQNQQAAQQQAQQKNDTGADFSKIMSIISMAMGALAMAQGAQQLSCCQTGCETGGQNTANTGTNTTNGLGVKGTNTINPGSVSPPPAPPAPPPAPKKAPLPPGMIEVRTFQTQQGGLYANAALEAVCPKRLPASMDILFNLFRPERAEATSCMGAMMALAQGGLMMLMGLMGMMAAKKGQQNAGISGLNASNLGTLANGQQNATGSSLGQGNAESIKIDPSLLRTPEANGVLSDFEKQFGIPRDDFASAVASGQDPRDILTRAPKNALSANDIAKATAAAGNLSDSQKKAALDQAGLTALQNSMLDKFGSDDNVYAGGGGGAKSSGGLKPKAAADFSDLLAEKNQEHNPNVLGLSPEVQEALAARALAANQKSISEMTLFEVVHRKYRERTTMMHGIGSGKAGPGVANADGM